MINLIDNQTTLPAISIAFLTYALFRIVFRRWLRPHLPPYAQRIGRLLLAVQVLLLGMHSIMALPITSRSRGSQPFPFWDLDGEWNVPASFSTLQMALVACVAWAIAFTATAQPRLQRLYWLVIGLGFFVLTFDEHLLLHERSVNLRRLYVFGGILLALATVVVLFHAGSRTKRYFLICVPFGLGLGAAGAFSLETANPCFDGFSLAPIICAPFFPLEETLENLGVLIVLLGVLGYAAVVIPTRRVQRARGRALSFLFVLIVALWLADQAKPTIHQTLFPKKNEILHQLRTQAQPVVVDYDEVAIALRGYIAPQRHIIFSMEAVFPVSLYFHAAQPLKENWGITVQLLDQGAQEVVAVRNQWSDGEYESWVVGKTYRRELSLEIPADVSLNRALWLVLTLWRQDGSEYPPLTITASDQQQLSDTQVVLGEYVFPAAEQGALPDDAPDYRFGNSFALRGAEIPANARTGDTLAIPFTWQAVSDSTEDWVQFLHFVHEETGALWNHDQLPLGARLPTRLWYEGLRDTEAWQITLPAELPPGRYAIYTGLYRLSDLARLPVSDADGMPLPDARVPLGSITISD